jgi:hypothetical protein
MKEWLPIGLQRAAQHLRNEIVIAVRHYSGRKRAKDFSSVTSLQLNFGCGPNLKHGWVDIDIAGPADLYLDLREPIPFKSGSVRTIYSEHFFEHLDYPCDSPRSRSFSDAADAARRIARAIGLRHVPRETSSDLRKGAHIDL